MRKTNLLCYTVLVIAAAFMASCQSNETRTHVSATPGEPIHDVTTTRLEQGAQDQRSGMNAGFGWVTANGVFTTKPVADTAGDPGDTVTPEVYAGGSSRSDGRVLKDTIPCGEQFIDVAFQLTGDPTTEDITTTDSIGSKTTQVYAGTDGQQLTLEDIYRYLFVESTLPTPHYEPSSSIVPATEFKKPVRYEETTDENVRIVWVTVTVAQAVKGTSAGDPLVQQYEVGYVQTKQAKAVEPEKDPYEVRIKDLQLFRTYRKKTQHSICEGYLSFGVYNTKTGELVEEITTDQFSMQLGKTGHFGAPTNGYIVGEARLVGSAPTKVEEKPVVDNEEAEAATHQAGNFTVSVSCTSQDYYVHFPVRGRDDSEGGMEAGGQNLFFEATLTYSRPATATEPAWTKTWSFTHKTDVNVVGWETRTPAVDRTGETVNDVDGQRKLQYAKSFVVEFVNHLYLDGEEIVQVVGDDDFYYPISKANGQTVPFHTSDMVIDCWTSYLP